MVNDSVTTLQWPFFKTNDSCLNQTKQLKDFETIIESSE